MVHWWSQFPMVDIKVFSLNCWGLALGCAPDRGARIEAIGQFLAESDYDLVVLQELWREDDFASIRSAVSKTLPCAHYFHYGNINGTGTCVFSKGVIKEATFHQFSLNGYPYKIQHGDWLCGKGLGVCLVDYKNLSINVFVSHYHAEYSRIRDIYLGHRVTQSVEASQWIKMTSSGSDLTIYAGDFNTEPGDLPHSILRTLVPLQDSWMEVHGPSGGETCSLPYNTYTPASELEKAPNGKRIDYIMYKSGTNVKAQAKACFLPLPRRIPDSLSRGKECSYSDHEALAATIEVQHSEDTDLNGNESNMDQQTKEHVIQEAMEVMSKSIHTNYSDRRMFILLSVVILALLGATFTRYILASAVWLDVLLFFVRLLLTLLFFVFVLMATVFGKKERHALNATKATLARLRKEE